jgi:4-hydroxy-3-polyprenylbenzoate decarboxylase
MTELTRAGAIICPATPSFYSKPQSIIEVVDTVVHRVISLLGLNHNGYQWGEQ